VSPKARWLWLVKPATLCWPSSTCCTPGLSTSARHTRRCAQPFSVSMGNSSLFQTRVLTCLSPGPQLLLHAGRCLQDEEALCSYGLSSGSLLQLSARLLGGGGDGGSTGAESRSCYLEMYLQRKPDKVNPAEEQLAK
jgi:hypothetical protein